MDSGELHILTAWGEHPLVRHASDASVVSCGERLLARASSADRVLLIADEQGERRCAALGLRTPHVAPVGVLRGFPLLGSGKRICSLLRRFPAPARVVCWEPSLAGSLRAGIGTIWKERVGIVDGNHGAAATNESGPMRLPVGNRAEIRAALCLPDSELVVLLASDPPDALSAHDFIRACALVALVGRNVTAIVPRAAPDMERAKSTLRTTGIPLRLITTELPAWSLLPGVDAVVVDVVEGSVPRVSSALSQRRIAETCGQLGIAVVWPEAVPTGTVAIDRWILRPHSRVAVHVARVLNEHLLSEGGPLLEPVGAEKRVCV